jgi:hypothetical protein
MKKWKVIEIRKTLKGSEFVVETICWSESKERLRRWLEEQPKKVLSNNYVIKEI